ncbi:MAG: hypothetical protein AB1453_06865 [Chloroflexota bacterium]|jgi:hypothetical protein
METEKTNPDESSQAESQSESASTPAEQPAASSSPIYPSLESAPSLAGSGSPTWLRRNMPWLAGILIALILGFGLAFFLLYQPAVTALQHTRQEAAQQMETINQMQTDLENTRVTLDQTRIDLKTTTTALEELQYQAALTTLQTNVAYARLALVTKDLLTARQELSAAQANLKKFAPLLAEQEIITALTERLALVRASITSDPAKSLEELRILAENLARLEKP